MTSQEPSIVQATLSKSLSILKVAKDLTLALAVYGLATAFLSLQARPFLRVASDYHYESLVMGAALAIWTLRSVFRWRKDIDIADTMTMVFLCMIFIGVWSFGLFLIVVGMIRL